jgi:hypothetical protein
MAGRAILYGHFRYAQIAAVSLNLCLKEWPTRFDATLKHCHERAAREHLKAARHILQLRAEQKVS